MSRQVLFAETFLHQLVTATVACLATSLLAMFPDPFLEASGSGNQGKVSLSKITAKMQYNHPNFYHNHYHLQNHNCQQNHYSHNIHPPPNLYHHQAKVKSKSKSKSKQDHSKKAAFCWEPASGKFGTDPQIIFIFFNCPVFSVFAVCLFVI